MENSGNRCIMILSTLLLLFTCGSAGADEMQDRMIFWRSKAFLCTKGGHSYPSKKLPSSDESSSCEDGDMTLFNGLLCAAGESAGCDGVAYAQGGDGRWWRSPGKIDMEWPNADVSFSPDMAFGVLLYSITKSDATKFKKWLNWIDQNRPCLIDIGGRCLFAGWPRFCTDDHDKRCTFRPTNCAEIESVGKKIGVSEGNICRRVLQSFKVRDDYVIPETEWAATSALVNDPGYSMHLAGVDLFLLERLGKTSTATRAGALALAIREPMNPFFLYLSEGATDRVKTLVLNQCPSPEKPSKTQMQWAWERTSSEEAWKDSMYWDCIFMGKLLGY